MTPNELGKIAYEKWAKLMHKLLSWEELTANTQQAWTGAAAAVSQSFDTTFEELQSSVEFWKKDSAEAWDKCEARRLEAETLRKILKGVGLALEEILNDSLTTERSIRAASVRGVVQVIEAALASTREPS